MSISIEMRHELDKLFKSFEINDNTEAIKAYGRLGMLINSVESVETLGRQLSNLLGVPLRGQEFALDMSDCSTMSDVMCKLQGQPYGS